MCQLFLHFIQLPYYPCIVCLFFVLVSFTVVIGTTITFLSGTMKDRTKFLIFLFNFLSSSTSSRSAIFLMTSLILPFFISSRRLSYSLGGICCSQLGFSWEIEKRKWAIALTVKFRSLNKDGDFLLHLLKFWLKNGSSVRSRSAWRIRRFLQCFTLFWFYAPPGCKSSLVKAPSKAPSLSREHK